jgi:hypothetical protein
MDPFLLRLIDELNFLADVLTEIESPALDLPGHHGADGIEANATSTGHGAASSSVPSW